MKFRLLLFILYRKLLKAAKVDERFKKFIGNKKLKFAIKTSSGLQGRQYIFDNGKMSSTASITKECGAGMVWCDADTAFMVMSSGDEETFVAALTEQKLQVEGNFKEFMWFLRALDIMMGKA